MDTFSGRGIPEDNTSYLEFEIILDNMVRPYLITEDRSSIPSSHVSSQLSVTPAPGDTMPSSAPWGHYTHVHIPNV